jgi:hypothetical protein
MMKREGFVRRADSTLPLFALAFLLTSCDDETPTSGNPSTTTTTAATSTASAFLRAAPFAFDAQTVDVVVSGANRNETLAGISYPEVSDYLELGPGDYRVQFFPAGSRRAAVAETTVTLSADEAVTVALVGLSAFEVTVLEDHRSDSSSGAGVTMTNVIPDFPAPLDAVVVNGPTLFQDVAYLESTDAMELIAGRYDVQIRRGGTDEPLATSTGNEFASGASYTIFAVGSLTRGDMAIVVASDMP